MTTYRKEFDKIYKKINKLAQKGGDYVYEYYTLIDEIIGDGLFYILEDVMFQYYKIRIKNFGTINEFKVFSFPEIRRSTNDVSSEAISRLFEQKSVYQVGYYIYDKNSNRYLGDIRETSSPRDLFYTNTRLQNLNIELQAEVGIPDSVFSAIPQFENNASLTQRFTIGNQVSFNGNLYQCILAYTFSYNNRVTPTYSAYWAQIVSPTYSTSFFNLDSQTLIQKYSSAIDFLRGFTFSNLSANSFVAEDYVDDYVE